MTKEICESDESVGCSVKTVSDECNVDEIEAVSQKPFGLACPKRCNL